MESEIYELYGTKSTSDNLQIEVENTRMLPFLSLTNEVVKQSTITSTEHTVEKLTNTLSRTKQVTINNRTTNEEQLIFICSAYSLNGILNAFYYDKEHKVIFNISCIEELEADKWKNEMLPNKVTTYSNVTGYNADSDAISIPKQYAKKLTTEPKSLVGKKITRLSLDFPGLNTNTRLKNIQHTNGAMSTRVGANALDVLKISTKDIGWDKDSPTLFTIFSYSAFGKQLTLFGEHKTDYIYIPLV